MDFLAFRFWVGAWIGLILLVFVALDLSSLVQYITRFTEECFSTLISLIFIMEAFKKVSGVWDYYPVGTKWDDDLYCYCEPRDFTLTTTSFLTNSTLTEPYSYENYTSMLTPDCVNVYVRITSYYTIRENGLKKEFI